jgi:ABC-2 type transport system permease protein
MVNLESKKLEDLLKFLIGLFLILIVNNVASRAFFRIDLTEEKRYTIAKPSRELLRNLDDVVTIEVFLAGDLPAGFDRFQKSIRETLEEFKSYAGSNIQYQFINPTTAISEKSRNQFMQRLNNKGIQPTNLFATEEGKQIEKLIFPGAIIYYGGREEGVMLLKGNLAAGSQERLNQSIEGIEYELIATIRSMVMTEKKMVGILKGHGTPDEVGLAGLKNLLRDDYLIRDVALGNSELKNLDLLMVVKPTLRFNESEKYEIDQYLMNGGKIFWLIDALQVSMDSLGGEGSIAAPYDLNLLDMLFQYGIRVNNNHIMDLNASAYPVVVGNMGDQPQIRPMPWPYFPLINNFGNHPVTRNLNAIYTQFISTIDTVKATGVIKTPLMFTSPYCKTRQAPYPLSLNQIREGYNPETFNTGPFTVSYLLYGTFTSVFKNRILPGKVAKENFLTESTPTKMIVVADGDIAISATNPQSGKALPLGFDPITQQQFANQDFILNAIAYLIDEDGLITARNKEIKIRPLDKIKVQEEKLKWQLINLALPLVVLILFGMGKLLLRKRKYGSS